MQVSGWTGCPLPICCLRQWFSVGLIDGLGLFVVPGVFQDRAVRIEDKGPQISQGSRTVPLALVGAEAPFGGWQ